MNEINNILSIEYDGILTNMVGKALIKDLINRGAEVWIVTLRLTDNESVSSNWNDDLYEGAAKMGIPKERILFSSFENKTSLINQTGACLHIDSFPAAAHASKDLDKKFRSMSFATASGFSNLSELIKLKAK